jgi:general secretion pathway protein G
MESFMTKPDIQKRKKDRGFTLVEVMVVMVIIGLLATFVVINVLPSQDKAMVQKAKADIRLLEQALEMYRLDMLDYPDEQAGLQALRTLPAGADNVDRYRQGGYVKFLPQDPWGRDYLYRYPGDHGVIDIFSYGQDGEEGGEGQAKDIVSWEP